MKKILLLLCLITSLVYAKEVTFDAQTIVVSPDDAVPAEQYAAQEFARLIGKAFQTEIKIVKENDYDGKTPAVFIGNTKFAAANGINQKSLKNETYIIKNIGNSLIIDGGHSRGTLNGTYEFLEKFAGCRFLDIKSEFIPELKSFSVPEKLELSGTPAFASGRNLAIGHVNNGDYENCQFAAKLKLNGRSYGDKLGYSARIGQPGVCHTYFNYSKNFTEAQKDFYSMDEKGKRQIAVDNAGPGQLCLSNSELRKNIIKQLRNFIESDRKLYNNPKGESAPVIYNISQNDNLEKCVCPNCLDAAKKYGAYSGLMLEFMNEIAADIVADYPDVKLETFAYQYTEKPPKNIKAHDNVIIQLAFLGPEYGGQRDTLRDINHPNNLESRQLIEDWRKIAKNLAIWDYWILYRERYVSPYTNISAIAPTLKYYQQQGIEKLFMESELCFNAEMPEISSFVDLKFYLGAKLMDNPDADAGKIIDDFLKHYYGDAAETMREYLNFLEKSMALEKNKLTAVVTPSRSYFTFGFFRQAEKLLKKAENSVPENSIYRTRINQEFIPVYTAILNVGDRLKSTMAPGEVWSFDREAMLNKLEAALNAASDKYFDKTKIALFRKNVKTYIDMMRNRIPVPPQFANFKIYDFTWANLQQGNVAILVDDAEAAGGKAIRLGGEKRDDYAALHNKPFQFGLYNSTEKNYLIPTVFPVIKTDEKYHWYKIGKTKLAPKTLMWFHWTWLNTQRMADSVFDPLAPNVEYEIWASIKLEGPAYVPGSTRKNAVSLDRIIFLQ